MNPERKVREEKNEEQKLTCRDIYDEIENGSHMSRVHTRFQQQYNLRQLYAYPPDGCSKDNIFKLLYVIAQDGEGLEGLPETKQQYPIYYTGFRCYRLCLAVARYLGFQPLNPRYLLMSWAETSEYLDDAKSLDDPFEMAYRADQLNYALQFESHRSRILHDRRFQYLQEFRLPIQVESKYNFDYFLKDDRSYVFMRQLVEAGCDLYTIRKRILDQDRGLLDRMWDQYRLRNDVRDITIPEIRPLHDFWPLETEQDRQRYAQRDTERNERYREAHAEALEQLRQREEQARIRYEARQEELQRERALQRERLIQREAQEAAVEDGQFWLPVEGSEIRDRRKTFNLGRSNSTFGHFQFFLLDDVKRVWGDNPPFLCDNPYDAITQAEIEEPLADNRMLISFERGIVHCWDAYGLSAYCAMTLSGHNFPKHPLTKEELTKTSLALIGFVHGILRESDEGYGVKRKYAQEVFDKFKNQAISELKALEIKEEVEKTFDNPTIAFKRMLCERKHWYDVRINKDESQDKIIPPGLCSAQPLKDFLDIQQYEAELLQKVTQTKAVIASRPPPPPRNPPTLRTVAGADLPDPNERGGPLRRLNGPKS